MIPRIPDLYALNYNAFSYQEQIKEVIIEANIKLIDVRAFTGCGRISKIILPQTLTNIGSDAFNLFLANPTRLGDGNCDVFISSTSPLTLARAAFCWKEYFSIYYCGNSYATNSTDLFAFSKSAVLKMTKSVSTFLGLTPELITPSLDCSFHSDTSRKQYILKRKLIKLLDFIKITLLETVKS